MLIVFFVFPQDIYESIEHVEISILTKSQPQTPKLRPENAQNTASISVDLTRPLHEPFKIKDLGLLTHIFRERAQRGDSYDVILSS